MDDNQLLSLALNHDDYALRLAVKLGLIVATKYVTGFDSVSGTGVWRTSIMDDAPEWWTAHGDDANAATRKTIVRAASYILKLK